jgi:hypothetical protein
MRSVGHAAVQLEARDTARPRGEPGSPFSSNLAPPSPMAVDDRDNFYLGCVISKAFAATFPSHPAQTQAHQSSRHLLKPD